jgi:hypothetical protein
MRRGPGAPRTTRTVVGARPARAAAPPTASRGRAAASDGGIAARRAGAATAPRIVSYWPTFFGQLSVDSTPREPTAGRGVAASAIDPTLAPPGADHKNAKKEVRNFELPPCRSGSPVSGSGEDRGRSAGRPKSSRRST